MDRPGWVPCRVGNRLLVAVTPWPAYAEFGGMAYWQVKVVRLAEKGGPVARYWLSWSTWRGGWARAGEDARLQRDLTPDELLELNSHMLDVLEGALC